MMITKQELLNRFDLLLTSQSIKRHINEISEIRIDLVDVLTDSEKIKMTNRIKTKLQNEANEAIDKNKDSFSAVIMATGTGKSKIVIDDAFKVACGVLPLNNANYLPKFLLVVPTEKLRDENWKEEFIKWNRVQLWENCIERTCYASLHTYEGQHFDKVYLDEGHNLSEAKSSFFEVNTVDDCILLTPARPSKDDYKIEMFRKLNIKPVYEITLQEAVLLGVIPPYEITIVTVPLDNTKHNIKTGSKKKGYYYVTEAGKYKNLTQMCLHSKNPLAYINRMQFIYQLKSKEIAAKLILEHRFPKELRTLIFCHSIKQAIAVCPYRYFSKPSIKKKEKEEKRKELEAVIQEYVGDLHFNMFVNEEIDRLACVKGLNEGHNIHNVQANFILQLDAKILNFIQRIGRTRVQPGLINKIVIMVAENTIDVSWANKATKGLDQSKIRYVTLQELKQKIEPLFLNI